MPSRFPSNRRFFLSCNTLWLTGKALAIRVLAIKFSVLVTWVGTAFIGIAIIAVGLAGGVGANGFLYDTARAATSNAKSSNAKSSNAKSSNAKATTAKSTKVKPVIPSSKPAPKRVATRSTASASANNVVTTTRVPASKPANSETKANVPAAAVTGSKADDPNANEDASLRTFVGGYGKQGVVSIVWSSAKSSTAKSNAVASAVYDLQSPTFLAQHPNLPILYAISETSGGRKNLRAITESGALVSSTYSGGESPVRLDINRAGDRLAVANYDGSIALYAIDATGAISAMLDTVKTAGNGPNLERQTRSHPHSVTFSANGAELWVADLGADLVLRFDLGSNRSSLKDVEKIHMPPGSGPRQVVLSGPLAYVTAELDGHIELVKQTDGTTALFTRVLVRANGRLGELTIDPTRRWMIALSRATNECVVFAIDGESIREVSATSCGVAPRHGSFSANGSKFFVASQKNDEVIEYTFHPTDGSLVLERSTPFAGPAVVIASNHS
jgi:6-phosphogluconolactonase